MLAHAHRRQVAAAGAAATSTAATLPGYVWSVPTEAGWNAIGTPSAGHVRHLPGGRAAAYL